MKIDNYIKKLITDAEALKNQVGDLLKNEGIEFSNDTIDSNDDKKRMKPKTEELIASLNKCKVEGNVVYLPPISEGMLPNYADVKKALINAGGKYKKNSFIFPSDAQPFIDRITGGESVNIKKEFQFFATPDAIADKMVEMAEITGDESILEPSAGQGAIINAIHRVTGTDKQVSFCELMDENRNISAEIDSTTFLCSNFLSIPSGYSFDRIIANPPFSKNQDIDHIYKMYEVLKPGGIMVTICSKHYQTSSHKKEIEFKNWLSKVDAEIEEIESGSFKESGTLIGALIIKIRKPINKESKDFEEKVINIREKSVSDPSKKRHVAEIIEYSLGGSVVVGKYYSHPRFGKGIIIELQKEGEVALIDFGGEIGQKQLLLRFAPLTEIGSESVIPHEPPIDFDFVKEAPVQKEAYKTESDYKEQTKSNTETETSKKEKKVSPASILGKVLSAQDVLKAMTTTKQLRDWAVSNGMDNRAAFPRFKLALNEIGMDYDSIKQGIQKAAEEKLESQVTHEVTLYCDAKASHNMFGITDKEGAVLWYGRFFQDEHGTYDGEQSSGELAAALKAVWLASKIKEAAGIPAIRLNLMIDAQWLTYQDHAGQKGYALTVAARKFNIQLNVEWIEGTSNPADEWTTADGYKKWSDNDLAPLAEPIKSESEIEAIKAKVQEEKSTETTKLPDNGKFFEIKLIDDYDSSKQNLGKGFTEYDNSYGVSAVVEEIHTDQEKRRKAFFPKAQSEIINGDLIVPSWLFDKKVEELADEIRTGAYQFVSSIRAYISHEPFSTSKKLQICFQYDANLVSDIKNIEGRKYNANSKCWELPLAEKGKLMYLVEKYEGKGENWKFLNELESSPVKNDNGGEILKTTMEPKILSDKEKMSNELKSRHGVFAKYFELKYPEYKDTYMMNTFVDGDVFIYVPGVSINVPEADMPDINYLTKLLNNKKTSDSDKLEIKNEIELMQKAVELENSEPYQHHSIPEPKILSEEITNPTYTPGDEDDIDETWDPEKGKKLKELFERYFPLGLKEELGIMGYGFDMEGGDILHLSFKKGTGNILLNRNAEPTSYTPNNRDALVRLSEFLRNNIDEPHDVVMQNFKHTKPMETAEATAEVQNLIPDENILKKYQEHFKDTNDNFQSITTTADELGVSGDEVMRVEKEFRHKQNTFNVGDKVLIRKTNKPDVIKAVNPSSSGGKDGNLYVLQGRHGGMSFTEDELKADVPAESTNFFKKGQIVYILNNEHTKAKLEAKGFYNRNQPFTVDHIIEERPYMGGSAEYAYALKLEGRDVGFFDEKTLSEFPNAAKNTTPQPSATAEEEKGYTGLSFPADAPKETWWLLLQHKTDDYTYMVTTDGTEIAINPYHKGTATQGEQVRIPISEVATYEKINPDLKEVILKTLRIKKMIPSIHYPSIQPSATAAEPQKELWRISKEEAVLNELNKFNAFGQNYSYPKSVLDNAEIVVTDNRTGKEYEGYTIIKPSMEGIKAHVPKAHYNIVKKALQEHKPVPDFVLQDYPGIMQEIKPKNTMPSIPAENPLIGDNYFKLNPSNILGEQVIEKGQYGSEFVKVKGSIDDLQKIDAPALNLVEQSNTPVSDKPQEEIIQEVFEAEESEVKKTVKKRVRKPRQGEHPGPSAEGAAYPEQEIYSLRETAAMYNTDISREELEAYFFTHHEFDYTLYFDKYLNAKDELVEKDLIVPVFEEYSGFKFHYYYTFISGNISHKISGHKKHKQEYIAEFGEDRYEKQMRMLEEVRPKQKGFIGDDRIILLPHAAFSKEFKLKELRFGPDLNGTVSLMDAFMAWLMHITAENFEKSNSREIIDYYLKNKSIPIDDKADSEERKRQEKNAINIRQRTKEEGDKLFTRFLAEELLPEDQARIAHLWNEKYNSLVEPNLDKIPIGFRMSKTFKNGKPLKLNLPQRRAAAFLMEKKSGLLAYGVGAGKTISAIACASQAIDNGLASKPLIVVPTNTYPKWLGDIQGYYDKDTKMFMHGALPHLPKVVGLFNLNSEIVRNEVKVYSEDDEKILSGIEQAIEQLAIIDPASINDPATRIKLSKLCPSIKWSGEDILHSEIVSLATEKGARIPSKAELLLKELKAQLNESIYTRGKIKGFPKGTIFVTTEQGLRKLGVGGEHRIRIENYMFEILSQGEKSNDDKKTSDKDVAKLQEKIAQTMSSSMKNAKLMMEDFGFDFACFDEAHYYKRLFSYVKGSVIEDEEGETKKNKKGQAQREKSKYELKSGAEPSSRALSAFLVSQFVQSTNDNRNIINLTATPFTNSPLEIYSMLTLTNYKALEDMDVANMVDFFDTFMRINYEIKYTAQKKVVKAVVLTGFSNVPQLRQIIYSVIDKKDDAANLKRPNKIVMPSKEKGIDVTLPMTLQQTEAINDLKAFINDNTMSYAALCYSAMAEEVNEIDFDGMSDDVLVLNYNTDVEPKEEFILEGALSEKDREKLIKAIKNVKIGVAFEEKDLGSTDEKKGARILQALSAMRQVTLSPYTWNCKRNPELKKTLTYKKYVESSPKLLYVMGCIRSVIEYHRSHGTKISGQVIYMNAGVEFFPLIKEYVVKEMGLLETQVGIVSGGMSKGAKENIKRAFLRGDILVLIGSATISVGVDLQDNATVLYNCYYDWNPTDAQQIEGRVWRQGNRFANVRIVYPMCYNSVDPVMFQYLQEKTSRINEIWNRDGVVSELDLRDFDPKKLQKELITDPEEKADWGILEEVDKVQNEKMYLENRLESIQNAQYSISHLKDETPVVRTKLTEISTLRMAKKRKDAKEGQQERKNKIVEKYEGNDTELGAQLLEFKKKQYDHDEDPEKKYVSKSYEEAPEEELYAEAKRVYEWLEKLTHQDTFVSDAMSALYYDRGNAQNVLSSFRSHYRDVKELKERVLIPLGMDPQKLHNPLQKVEAKILQLQGQLDAIEKSRDERIAFFKAEAAKNRFNVTVEDRVREFSAMNYLLDQLMPEETTSKRTFADALQELDALLDKHTGASVSEVEEVEAEVV